MQESQIIELQHAVFTLKDDHQELSIQVKMLSAMTERLIRLEEREEARYDGIKRAHLRIDSLVKLFWGGASGFALAIFSAWITKRI